MSLVTEQHSMRNPRAVLHWYDFLCPFCYIGQSRNGVPEVKKTAHYVTKARAERQPSLRELFSPRAELDQFSLLRLRDGSPFPLKVCRYVKLNYAGHHSILRSWRSFWSGLAVGCCRRVTHHPKPPRYVNQDHPEKRSHTCLACRAFARFVWRLPNPNRQNAFRQ